MSNTPTHQPSWPLRYGSVCSGIEAATAAWEPLGFHAQWFSEIEPFPSAVLAHRYPEVPNHGDMTKFKEWPNQNDPTQQIDILVGGTPCQSFSVAGLRKGLDDPRGSLMLTYLAIAERYRPRWVVWENVPGVLSSNNGRDFGTFLDGLEELRYVVDVDILDARYFGVPQRRRRVFVCAESITHLLRRRSSSSALTIIKCISEILHGILVEALPGWQRSPKKKVSASLSRDGVLRRIKLFGMLGETGEDWKMCRENLVAACQWSRNAAKNSDAKVGENEPAIMAEDLLTDTEMGNLSIPTDESLKSDLDVLYDVMKSFTTSTSTKITTTQITSLFSLALSIARLTCRLNISCRAWSDTELSVSMLLKEFTRYAGQASDEVFGGVSWLCEGDDLYRQAKETIPVVGYLGDWRRAAAVLFEQDSMRGDIATSGEAGEEVAANAARGADKGSHWDDPVNPHPSLTQTARASGGIGASNQELFNQRGGGLVASDGRAVFGNVENGQSATLSSREHKGLSCGRDGLTSAAVLAFPTEMSGTQVASAENQSPALSVKHTTSVCFAQNTRDEVRLLNGDGETAGALAARPGAKQQSYVAPNYTAPRRLTPIECERLMGFPDNFTQIPYRNKATEDCSTGHRYKALGNSMAVPVMRWLGEGIEMVEGLDWT